MYSKQKSFNFGHYIPNDKVLNKKVPENPKYKHVKPAIDTGKSVRRHIDELKEKQKNSHYKKDEVYKRIKFSTFIKLALAVATEFSKNENNTDCKSASATMCNTTEVAEHKNFANVLMGIGELDLVNEKKKSHSPHARMPDCHLPYLLLDVRDKDAFSNCHIKTAKHYPSSMLSRSTGYEIEDMKLFKNRPHDLIILYDDDEVIASRVASTLVERGYNNVYLLAGGLKLALEICPQGLTTSNEKLTPLHGSAEGPATSLVQKCSSKEYFSKEDVDIIQSFIDTYPNKGNRAAWSSRPSQSRASYQKINILNHGYASSQASSVSKRTSTNSACTAALAHIDYYARTRSSGPSQFLEGSRSSSASQSQTRSLYLKNAEPVSVKSTIAAKTKTQKKTPWK